MPNDFIKSMIWKAIESYPIDETKKADILQNIADHEKTEEDL